jgi:hypothetical protein
MRGLPTDQSVPQGSPQELFHRNAMIGIPERSAFSRSPPGVCVPHLLTWPPVLVAADPNRPHRKHKRAAALAANRAV